MFLERNDFVMTLVLFIHFYSASSCKWNAIFVYSIYGIEESDVSGENLYYIIWYLKRKKCIVKNLFIMCLLLQRGINTPWIPLIIICYSIFFQTFIYLEIFHSVSIFKGFIMLVRIMLIHAFLNLHAWSI